MKEQPSVYAWLCVQPLPDKRYRFLSLLSLLILYLTLLLSYLIFIHHHHSIYYHYLLFFLPPAPIRRNEVSDLTHVVRGGGEVTNENEGVFQGAGGVGIPFISVGEVS